MKIVELGKLCTVVRGSSPRPKGDPKYYGGKVPRLMVADLTRDGMYVTPQIDSLTEAGAKKSRPMLKGDFVVAVSGNPGEPCILKVDACIHDGFVGLRNLDKSVSSVFLYHFFKYFKNKNKAQAVGAIYKNLNTAQIKALKIPLPPLPEQKKIAALLDEADNLRQLNRQLIEKYEALTESLFLEMFGDPVLNTKGWEKKKLNDVLEITSSRRIFKDEYVSEGIPFFRTKEIVELSKGKKITSELFISNNRFEEIKIKNDLPSKGDILLSAVGTIGVMWTIDSDSPFYFKDGNLVWLKASKVTDMNSNYLRMTLNYLIEHEKEKLSQGAAYNALTIAKLKNFTVNIAPEELQNNFAKRLKNIEAQKTQAQAALAKSEELFNSLLQRAFKGDL